MAGDVRAQDLASLATDLGDGAPEAFEDVWRVNCLGAFHGIQASGTVIGGRTIVSRDAGDAE